MTWAGQVLHVVGKDVRQFKWWLLAIALVSIGITYAFDSSSVPDLIATFSPLVLGILVALFVVQSVQAESPWGLAAEWRALPLQPSAVLTAKLANVALVIAVLSVGQSVQLHRLALSGSAFWFVLAWSWCVALSVSLIAMSLGAITEDVAAAIVVMIAWGIGSSGVDRVVRFFAGAPGTSLPASDAIALLWLFVNGATMLIALRVLYRSPVRRRVVTTLIAVWMLAGARALDPIMNYVESRTLPMARGVTATIRCHTLDNNSSRCATSLQLPARVPNVRHVLDSATLHLAFPNGTSRTVALGDWEGGTNRDVTAGSRTVLLDDPATVPGTSLRWPEPEQPRGISSTLVRLDDATRELFRRGQVTSYVTGTIRQLEAVPLRLRRTPNSSVSIPGARAALDDSSIGANARQTIIRYARINRAFRASSNDEPPQGALGPAYLFVSATNDSVAWGSWSGGGWETLPATLPGSDGQAGVVHIVRGESPFSNDAGLSPWLRRADVMQILWRDRGRTRFETPHQVLAPDTTATNSRGGAVR